MESSAIAPVTVNDPVAHHQPSATWSLDARLAATWWRNPNARGIAEPDPRTVAPGARPRRALASPCPHSKRRVRRERELHTQLAQVARLDAQLVQLTTVWPEPERPRALARELHEARGDLGWVMEDPTWTTRGYERRSPVYLPRRACADAARFRRAHRAAVAFIRFADRQLHLDRENRLRALLSWLKPEEARARFGAPRASTDEGRRAARPAPRSRQPITPDLDDQRDIRRETEVVAASEDLKRTLDRIERRFFDVPPPTTT